MPATFESHYRSIVKALCWRFIATCTTVSVAWIVTGEVIFAAKIGLADSLIKLGLYYAHERIWNYIPLGKMKPIEYEI